MTGQIGQLHFGLCFKPFVILTLVPVASVATEFIAITGLIGQRLRPGCPRGGLTGDIFQRNAIHRARRHAQFTPCAIRLDNRVHQLVGAQYGVGGTGLDAERTADAPGLVDHRNRSGAFQPIGRVQGGDALTGERSQAPYAFGAARWALVDGNSPGGYGLGVGRAVRITTTCALGLGQCRQNPGDEFRHGSWVWPTGYFLRATFVATGFMTGLAAGLATAFTTGFAAVFVAARADLTPTEATFGFDTGDPLVVEAG